MYDYSYGYDAVGASVGIFAIMAWVGIMVICVLIIAANWGLFTKAGVEGWKAIIPFYNTYVMTELAGLHIVWFILSLVPCANFVASIVILFDYLKSYEVPVGMRILAVFFPYIVYPIVAFSSKYQYVGVGE